jgi:hypothetical protein
MHELLIEVAPALSPAERESLVERHWKRRRR